MFNIPCILPKLYKYPLLYDASYRHESSPFFFSYFLAASWKFVTHSFTSGSFMGERFEDHGLLFEHTYVKTFNHTNK